MYLVMLRYLLRRSFLRLRCLHFEPTSRQPILTYFHLQKNNKSNEHNSNNDLKKKLNAWPFIFGAALLAKEQDDSSNDTSSQSMKSRKKIFNFIADVVDETLPSIVQIEIRKKFLFGVQTIGSGSGFIVSEDGYILTNAHVVQEKNADLIIKLNDGRVLPGRVIKMDILSDLAVIKVETQNVIEK
jgi:S1-C subfamily serine protease